MSLKISVTRNHNFSSGLVTRAALNAGATPTVSLTGSVDTAEIADASINNNKIAASAAISLSKLGDLDAGNILTGGGDYPVATSLKSTTNFSNPHHSGMSNPGSTFKATLLLGNDTTTTTAVMSGDGELKADGTLFIDPTFVSGKSALLAQTSSPDATMISDSDTLLVVDDSETPDKYKKITFANLKTSIDTTANVATDTSVGVVRLGTYNDTYMETSGVLMQGQHLAAHQCVPVGWVSLYGRETNSNHTDRRTSTSSTSPLVNSSRSHNFTSCTKTGCGTYTVVFHDCPSSRLMLMATLTSWGEGTTSSSQGEVIPMAFRQTSQSGGNSSSGGLGTVSFSTYTGYTTASEPSNFHYANLVLYAG